MNAAENTARFFRILEKGTLGFVQVWWEESYVKVGDDMILEINDEPNPSELDQILSIKGVSVYEEDNH